MKHIHKASRHFMQGHDVGLTGGENREEVGKGGGEGGSWGPHANCHSPTLITFAVVQPEQVVQALAAALLPLLVTEVIRIREDP